MGVGCEYGCEWWVCFRERERGRARAEEGERGECDRDRVNVCVRERERERRTHTHYTHSHTYITEAIYFGAHVLDIEWARVSCMNTIWCAQV